MDEDNLQIVIAELTKRANKVYGPPLNTIEIDIIEAINCMSFDGWTFTPPVTNPVTK